MCCGQRNGGVNIYTITFFYSDSAERQTLEPLYREAKRRGYNVRFSVDLDLKCSVGVYCQHAPRLRNKGAKFSVIILHDMAQSHNRWPQFWNAEPWDGFDLGILPNKSWEERWLLSAGLKQANPKLGVYTLGWPKADAYFGDDKTFLNGVEKLRRELNLKYDFTVLYAPSWEHGGRMSSFVRLLKDLPVNLLIKEAYFPAWPQYQAELENEENKNRGVYENVYVIDASVNLLQLLPFSHLLVSEESSALLEAQLFGAQGVSISDWLVPDTVPPRPPVAPYDYIEHCLEAELPGLVQKMLRNEYSFTTPERDSVIAYLGKSSEKIMDLIECSLNGGENEILKFNLQKPEVLKKFEEERQTAPESESEFNTTETDIIVQQNILMNEWIYMKRNGFNFARYFETRGWKSAAVFGRNLADRFCEELSGTDVKLSFLIDEDASVFYIFDDKIPVVKLAEAVKIPFGERPDVLVVMDDYIFPRVRELFARCWRSDVIALSDVLIM